MMYLLIYMLYTVLILSCIVTYICDAFGGIYQSYNAHHGHGSYSHSSHGGYGHSSHGGYGHNNHGGYGHNNHGGYGHNQHGGYGQHNHKGYGHGYYFGEYSIIINVGL